MDYSELGEEIRSIPLTQQQQSPPVQKQTQQRQMHKQSPFLRYMPNMNEEGDHEVVRARRGFGVFREHEPDDIAVLVNNFTAPALARALREREEILHIVAALCDESNTEEARHVLAPFLKKNVDLRRHKKRFSSYHTCQAFSVLMMYGPSDIKNLQEHSIFARDLVAMIW